MPVLLRTRGLESRPIAPAQVRVRAERMLEALGLEDRELSLMLCGDEEIRGLNATYRGIDKPTDVLAFPQDPHEESAKGSQGAPQMPSLLLGDVVISLPTARRQAKKAGKTIVAEVTMLLAHGLLHLLGFDHRTPVEERRMKARTDVLCAAAQPKR